MAAQAASAAVALAVRQGQRIVRAVVCRIPSVYHVSGVQCIVLCAGGVNSVWGVQGVVGAP